MTHGQLSEMCLRPPGIPPSHCNGPLVRVDGSGDVIHDDALATLIEATRRLEGGKTEVFLRNAWQPKPEPSGRALATA